MSSSWLFILLITYLHIAFITAESDVCIWQRTDASTTYINGLYTYIENGNNAAYYAKLDENCEANNLYIYPTSQKWHIGPTLGDQSDYIAICLISSVDNPAECGDNWQVK